MDGDVDGAAPDAFQALGNEVRLSVLRTLFERESPVSFSELHEASPVEESAGFAYHLRQLTDRYVRQVDDEGYALTYAGREVARAVAAGTYTDSVALDPESLAEPCPFCGAERLRATGADNRLGVDCEACGRPVLSLPFPPGGYRDREPAAVPRAFDAHHRHRLALLREGVCPECAGSVTATVERVDAPARSAGGPDEREAGESSGGPDPVQATFVCAACGYEARSPVALTLLTHPAVVAHLHEHGVDPRDRPIWNVGEEFREAVVSEDPFAVVVSIRFGGDLLELFVDRRAGVVDYRTSTDGDREDPRDASETVDAGDPAVGASTPAEDDPDPDDAGTVAREDPGTASASGEAAPEGSEASGTAAESSDSGGATATDGSGAEPA